MVGVMSNKLSDLNMASVFVSAYQILSDLPHER